MNKIYKETISSNCLFHFTNSAENLLNILEKEFYPHYSLEDLRFISYSSRVDSYYHIAIPMVSFCDLPLSKIKTHISVYGNFGIGMKKSWGLKNGICPVIYANENSTSTRLLQSGIKGVISRGEVSEITPISKSLGYQVRFYKPYTGNFIRNSNLTKNYNYYDEREWRYVPDTESLSLPFCMYKNKFENSVERAETNKELATKVKINFNPNDIKYIIIENESQLPAMIRAIMRIKNKFDEETRLKLISRIISIKNIVEDF